MAAMRFRVINVNDGGPTRVNVGLQSVPETNPDGTIAPGSQYTNTINLNLDSAEADAAGYWPGKEFDVTLAAVTAPA